MARLGNFSMQEMRRLQRDLQKLKKKQRETFMAACAKELAARLLTLVIPITPVDGGTLRRGWIAKTQSEAEAAAAQRPTAPEVVEFVNNLRITKSRGMVSIEIINPVEYASYVEFGHRQQPGRYVPALGKRLKKAWVPGQLMMNKSIDDLERIAPQVLEHKLKRMLEVYFR